MKEGTIDMNHEVFYHDGQFDSTKAKQAYYDLMATFHVPNVSM
jgi:hypothetical protein